MMQRLAVCLYSFLALLPCWDGRSVYAITPEFLSLCLATALQGVFQATSGFYRFAAVEGARPV
jgi:hypothetical protein